MKQVTENQDRGRLKSIKWQKTFAWTAGGFSLIFFMPAVLALGYFVTVFCLIAVPLGGLIILLASLTRSSAHERWGTTLKAVEDLQPDANIIVLENYLRKKNNRQDVFLAS